MAGPQAAPARRCGRSIAPKLPSYGLATWRRSWNEVVPFFTYPPQIQKMIYTTDEMDKRFCAGRGIFSCAGDLVAKRGVTAGSACLAGLRRSRTCGFDGFAFHRATKRV